MFRVEPKICIKTILWIGKIRLDPTKRHDFHMPIFRVKKVLWFLSPILKLLGGWKMLLIILMKGIAVAGWRRGWWKKLAKRFLTKGYQISGRSIVALAQINPQNF